MTFSDIYKLFIEPTKENFPIKNCTKQNKREQDVFDSDTPYLCLVIDRRFSNEWNLIVLYPYICKESDTFVTFGWVDRNGNVFGNINNSTQLWEQFVVGFKDYTELETVDIQLWDKFITKIDNQYDD